MSNRLPILAADIRRAHADVFAAAKTAAEHAITAGHALIEARGLLMHGEWLPWLREHCALAERTAQLYMQIAKSGLEAEIVAEIGLKAAAKVNWTLHYPNYNPFAHCDERGKLQWRIFELFLARESGWHAEGAWAHVEWILQRQFATPDEWLGEEGASFRQSWGMRGFTDAGIKSWVEFLSQHGGRALSDLEAELESICRAQGDRPSPKRGRRKRAKSAPVADFDRSAA